MRDSALAALKNLQEHFDKLLDFCIGGSLNTCLEMAPLRSLPHPKEIGDPTKSNMQEVTEANHKLFRR